MKPIDRIEFRSATISVYEKGIEIALPIEVEFTTEHNGSETLVLWELK